MKSLIKKYLGKRVKVIVDRPLGSKHPEFKNIYPINYGYLPKTVASDGEGIDVYILGVDKPVRKYEGKVIAVIHRLDDDDDKLIVVPEKKSFSDAEIKKLTYFQERYFKSKVLRKK